MISDEANAHQQDEKKKSDEQQNTGSEDDRERAGILETLFTIVSVLLIAAIAIYLVREAARTQTPAAFTLKSSDPITRGNFMAVDVYVANGGDMAAKAIHLKGTVPGPDGSPVEGEATMDWLPGRSTRRATLLFPKDAQTTTPKIEVVGHEAPF